MQIIGVKTNIGYYITLPETNRSVFNYIVNGYIPEHTFHKDWGFVEKKPTVVERTVKQPRINHRFELISDSPWIGKVELPQSMPKAEVMEENNDGYCGWKEEFEHLQSLYREVSDEQPDKVEAVEFEYKTILEIPEIKIVEDFSYTIQATEWEHKGTTELKNNKIINQLIDKIVFPSIVTPNLPCKLSSEDSYKIIREYVKNNIDGRYARITSDFNFCFTVKKNVILIDPLEMKRKIKTASGRSYAKRRYREWTVKTREFEVFEMTYSPHNYKGYTPIIGFSGKTHQDLKKNIDKYLKNLIHRLNEPLKDCPHCDGLGVIIHNNSKQEI